MRKPKMILFDYGQTLANQKQFDGIAGTKAVMKYATKNKYNHTAEDVMAAVDAINMEIADAKHHLVQIEVPNHMFTAYLYQSLGIEISLTAQDIDRVFWNAASPGVPSDGIEDFLEFLKEQGIRTGVITNITFCGDAVIDRINNLLPKHNFEFIIATSEYMFRKPNKRIFELALGKADLQPEDVWYIGDNYLCDVVGARSAGIFPVWYIGATADPKGEDDVLTISHWDELQRQIEELTNKEGEVNHD